MRKWCSALVLAVLACWPGQVTAQDPAIQVRGLYWPAYPGYENVTWTVRSDAPGPSGSALRTRETYCMWPALVSTVAAAMASWASGGGACSCGQERCYVVNPMQRNPPPPQDWYGLANFSLYCKSGEPGRLWVAVEGGGKSGLDAGDNALGMSEVSASISVDEATALAAAMSAWAANPTYATTFLERRLYPAASEPGGCPSVSPDHVGLQLNGYNGGVPAEVHLQVLSRLRDAAGGRSARVGVQAHDLWPAEASALSQALSAWTSSRASGNLWSSWRYVGLAADPAAPSSGEAGPHFPMHFLEAVGSPDAVTLRTGALSNNGRNAGWHAAGQEVHEYRLAAPEVQSLAAAMASWASDLGCRGVARISP